MESIIVSIVTGVCSIIGVILAASASSRKLQQQLEVSQAVTNTKLEALTNEVRAHNGFAQKIPVLSERIDQLSRRISEIERKEEPNDKK